MFTCEQQPGICFIHVAVPILFYLNTLMPAPTLDHEALVALVLDARIVSGAKQPKIRFRNHVRKKRAKSVTISAKKIVQKWRRGLPPSANPTSTIDTLRC